MWYVLDTFGDFEEYWCNAGSEPVERQVELWRTVYMSRYPELFAKQVADYEKLGIPWRFIAVKRIFPRLPELLPRMQKAHKRLPRLCGEVYRLAKQNVGLDFDVWFVLYVGIGCGAGWATRYRGDPACLLGLENIAENRWHTPDRLRGLLAHELGHLIHIVWRGDWKGFIKSEESPLFLLYSEGFAQRCQHLILGREIWHQDRRGWLAWCRKRLPRLAAEYLRRVDAGEPTNVFFGSWAKLWRRSETGYFLGHEFVKWLEEKMPLRELALLPQAQVEREARAFLSETSEVPRG